MKYKYHTSNFELHYRVKACRIDELGFNSDFHDLVIKKSLAQLKKEIPKDSYKAKKKKILEGVCSGVCDLVYEYAVDKKLKLRDASKLVYQDFLKGGSVAKLTKRVLVNQEQRNMCHHRQKEEGLENTMNDLLDAQKGAEKLLKVDVSMFSKAAPANSLQPAVSSSDSFLSSPSSSKDYKIAESDIDFIFIRNLYSLEKDRIVSIQGSIKCRDFFWQDVKEFLHACLLQAVVVKDDTICIDFFDPNFGIINFIISTEKSFAPVMKDTKFFNLLLKAISYALTAKFTDIFPKGKYDHFSIEEVTAMERREIRKSSFFDKITL
ncbi:hypothetical protein [Candidatus Sneabacter namystus]|uniref:Uncharacterized protein n=1 Tax=Candidatus Sneabacter namystus TaxID=2601646 RepID=A0A5C0UHP8_9RICK|nr:hypothetical protein [Candidatus Sneabacter namystus]QEK39695.1 hypothetical protein FZC37_01985 [Candidatus Sneabacter namystus]